MSLAPALLLSMPQLLDANFARTVVDSSASTRPKARSACRQSPGGNSAAAEAVSLTPPIESPE
jgi:hypothetical protein